MTNMYGIKEKIIAYAPAIMIMIFSFLAFGKMNANDISGWGIGELLINYEGGFVRRGLLGQIAFETLDPVFFVTKVQKLVVGIFFVSLIFVVFVENSLWVKWLLAATIVFHSGGLYDFTQSNGFEYLERKEIWFYVSMFITIILSKAWGFYNIKTMVSVSLISTIMILHHEIYAFYCLPLLFLLVSMNKDRLCKNLLIVIMPPALTFLLVLFNHGDPALSNAIRISYVNQHDLSVGGGVDAIGWVFNDSFRLSVEAAVRGSIAYWIFFFLLSFSMVSALALSKFNKLNDLAFISLLNMLLMVATAILVISGWDWGRWVSMYGFFSIYSIYLYEISLADLKEKSVFTLVRHQTVLGADVKYKILMLIFMILVIFLTSSTRMSHCCPQNNTIELQLIDKLKTRAIGYLRN